MRTGGTRDNKVPMPWPIKLENRVSYDELLRDHQRLSEYRKYAEVREQVLMAEIRCLRDQLDKDKQACIDGIEAKSIS